MARPLLGNWRSYGYAMNRLLIVAILLISAAPVYAQAQQPNMAKLKADAQKVVSIISADEAKTQTYCEARDIAKQFVQAQQQKENEKVEELADIRRSSRCSIRSTSRARTSSYRTSIADEMREEHQRRVQGV